VTDKASLSEARLKRLLLELRDGGVVDPLVLAALEWVPRDRFVSAPFLDRAFDNAALPIACNQTISQPLVVGLMTQELEVTDRMKVLEIGTGSGYQTAVLSRLCRRVYSIERHKALLTEAEGRLKALHIHNFTTRLGDGSRGWPEQAPFDRIMVTAAAHDIPPVLVEQLKPGGIMVLPVGESPSSGQDLLKVTKTETGLEIHSFLPVRFVPLVEGVPES
jgi:protein-L-isoaspartate(D-aspartate) O-methyltransferase